MDRWRGYLRAGLTRMLGAGLLRAGSDPEKLSLAIFASLQGGFEWLRRLHRLREQQAALDAALTALRAAAADPPGDLGPNSERLSDRP
jgi:hypothetical protein